MTLLARLWFAPIRLAFWLFYNPLAWTYDPVSRIVSRGYWRRWQRTALPELRGPQVLELACGTGNMLVDLGHLSAGPVEPGETQSIAQVIGVELSPWMVHMARRKLRQAGLSVPVVRGRAQQLPFPDAQFDSLLATFPAGFILDPQTWHEAARVLKPDGRMVIVAAGILRRRDLWSRVLEWLYRITGQRALPDLDRLAAFAGLTCRAAWRRVGDTEVLIYVIERDPNPDEPEPNRILHEGREESRKKISVPS